MNYKILLFFCSCLPFYSLFAEKIAVQSLMKDLEIVRECEKKTKEPLYVSTNLHGVVGTFVTPSARMHEDGVLGFGASYIKPYVHYYLFCQPTSRLELSGAYRIFKDLKDSNLSRYGFGDYADKGANLKFCLIDDQDNFDPLPSIAIGFDDFMGSSLFESSYIVATKTFYDQNLELSLGYGQKRLKGFFSALNWQPWQKKEHLFKDLKLSAEYNPTNYENDPHPRGREKKSKLHYGATYRFADFWQLRVASVRGYSASLETKYPFGTTNGFIAKSEDPLPYLAPRNYQKIGPLRSEKIFAQECALKFAEQGLILRKLSFFAEEKGLFLSFENDRYQEQTKAHAALICLLSSLCPSNIEKIHAIEEREGLPIQEFHFLRKDLLNYQKKEISLYELKILSSMKEAKAPKEQKTIYNKSKDLFSTNFFPRMRTLFGSASGKFKFELGLGACLKGFLFDELFYRLEGGYMLFSNLESVRDIDRINPSQIINVASDYVNYRRSKKWHLEEALIQKNLKLSKSFYGRVAGGFFQINYGGLAAEALYFPVNQNWAIGIEYALLKKRSYRGMGFQKIVRKLEGFQPQYQKFHPRQYFIDLYYDFPELQVECKMSAGQFLAFDRGVRTELTRYFQNGLRLGIWHSRTNAKDFINSSRYFDTGVSFSVPMDIFYTYSSRQECGYAMSAWLRDIASRSHTGQSLYSIIKAERR